MEDLIIITNLNDFIFCPASIYFHIENMAIVSYDISDDKLRTKFSKYLSRFGHRIQYSVFEIDNSKRIVDNIVNDLTNNFEKAFHKKIVL